MPGLAHVLSSSGEPALPSLAALLTSIEQMSQRFPPPEEDDDRHSDLVQRQLRRLGSPRRRMPQAEHCDYLSLPRKKPERQLEPDRAKQIQLARRREGERRLAALKKAAQLEDTLTRGVVTRARHKLMDEHGAVAGGFLDAEDAARDQRIVRAAHEHARSAVSAPRDGSSSSSGSTLGFGRARERAVQEVLQRAQRGHTPDRGTFTK